MGKGGTRISAFTLLEKVIEFTSLPRMENEVDFWMADWVDPWSYEGLKESPSRLLKLKQIEILMNMYLPEFPVEYTLRKKLFALENGKFTKLRKLENYQHVFEEMNSLIDRTNNTKLNNPQWELEHLEKNYNAACWYKKDVKNQAGLVKNWVEEEPFYFYSEYLINTVSESIDLTPIDNFLALVIDPQKRIFEMEYLIKQYDYPSD